MTQDEVNDLVGKRDDAARAMLAALKVAQKTMIAGKQPRWQDAQVVSAAIAQAEAAGIKAEG